MVIGDTYVGKSTLVHYFINGTLPRHRPPPTTGVQNQYKTVDVPDGGKDGRPLKMKLDIWDTSGTERM